MKTHKYEIDKTIVYYLFGISVINRDGVNMVEDFLGRILLHFCLFNFKYKHIGPRIRRLNGSLEQTTGC